MLNYQGDFCVFVLRNVEDIIERKPSEENTSERWVLSSHVSTLDLGKRLVHRCTDAKGHPMDGCAWGAEGWTKHKYLMTWEREWVDTSHYVVAFTVQYMLIAVKVHFTL